MAEKEYPYAILGAGLAGASAVEGIREQDPNGSILMIGGDRHLPYHRPSLSKGLWSGKEKEKDIFVHDQEYYDQHGVTLFLGAKAVSLNPHTKILADDHGRTYRFRKLLLATGGTPKLLPIPGADLPGIFYYRTLDDYHAVRNLAVSGRKAVVIGGGFIGSEITAALTQQGVAVTMVFADPYLCSRVLPEELGRAVQDAFAERGVRILANDQPATFSRREDRWRVGTAQGEQLDADLLIVGVGIRPAVELAEKAGLQLGNGVAVNEFLQTSDPDIYAAGDLAEYEYPGLHTRLRLEHWDNALNQGKWAGRNLAGAGEKFTYQAFFFSDLFDFGYEAVGEIDSRLATYTDWQTPNRTGVIYYHREGRVRGVMLCGLPDRIERAREILNRPEKVLLQDLAGAIR